MSKSAQSIHTIGPLRIFAEGHYVFVEDREVPVTATEMRLINYLIARRGEVCAPAELLSAVWGLEPATNTRTILTTIKRLRDKLGPAGSVIETVRGAGYRLAG